VQTDGDARVSTAAPPLVAVAVLLALLCIALYVNAMKAELVGAADRDAFAVSALRWHELTLANWRAALASPHPVVVASYGLNYRIGRIDLHGYHAVNAALHFVNALLVYALGRALFRRTGLSDELAPWGALASAALFAAHPLQVEAVTWIAQRGVLLAALGSLAALACYLRGREAASRGARAAWWLVAAAGWGIALGSRETALALPIALALCEWAARDRPARALPIALGAAIAVAIVWLGAGPALAMHESLVVWPLPQRLSLVHDADVGRAVALALQLGLLGAAVALARRARIASFALLWFFVWQLADAALAPGPLAAEHRNYLALAGPALAAAGLLFGALPRSLGLATALSVLAAASLGAATHSRNELWRSASALWDDAVAKSPSDATARLERGALFEQRGRADDALADYGEAVRVAPRSALARERLAAALASFGRERDALPHALEGVALDPASAAAHVALGRIQAALGALEPAVSAFARARELGGEPGLERRFADTLVRLGRYEDALPHYDAAIASDPGDDDARTGAGAALTELARARDALAYLEPAVESQPNPRYLAHFADALWQLGDAGGALDAISMAVRVAPSWPGGPSRLVWMLANAPDGERRDPARALRVADLALTKPGAPDAALVDARAAALAAAGRFGEARTEADRAAAAARDAGDVALAAQFAAHAERYARRELVRDPPRPFEASP
jgi:tetratricopeptide (TPR) repeat protein